MALHLQIEMPDGSKWAVPVEVIAMNRAVYYAKHDGITIEESLEKDTRPLFAGSPYDIEDWAANNMNWEDVEHLAVCVSKGEADYQEGWVNGQKEVIEI